MKNKIGKFIEAFFEAEAEYSLYPLQHFLKIAPLF